MSSKIFVALCAATMALLVACDNKEETSSTTTTASTPATTAAPPPTTAAPPATTAAADLGLDPTDDEERADTKDLTPQNAEGELASIEKEVGAGY